MVDHKTHRERTKKRLGDEYAFVHHIMDSPFAWTFPTVKKFNVNGVEVKMPVMERLGRRHRMIFHDLETALLLGLKYNDFKVFLAALSHLKDDGIIK